MCVDTSFGSACLQSMADMLAVFFQAEKQDVILFVFLPIVTALVGYKSQNYCVFPSDPQGDLGRDQVA